MKKIGMIVAVEIDAVLKKYGGSIERLDYTAFDVKKYRADGYELYIVSCGAGEIAAAAAAQFIISELKVDMVVNFGVVGGLTPEMAVAKLCVVESVVHYDFDISECDDYEPARYSNYPSIYIPTTPELVDAAVKIEPSLKRVICASGDKFVASGEKKRAMHTAYGTDICEMEAAGIALTCNRNGVPFLMIKAVSDAMDGGAGEFTRELNRCADICINAMDKIIEKLPE